jgi:hypothetical protein
MEALGSVGGRLDAPNAAETVKDLLARLDRKDVDLYTQGSLLDVIGTVGKRLDARGAAETAKDLISLAEH